MDSFKILYFLFFLLKIHIILITFKKFIFIFDKIKSISYIRAPHGKRCNENKKRHSRNRLAEAKLES